MKSKKKRSAARPLSTSPSRSSAPPAAPSPQPAARPRWPILLGLLFCAIAALVLVPIACGSRSAAPNAAAASLPVFDSAGAWRHLQAQLAMGTRPVGTPAHEQLKDYLAARMRENTSDVQLQQWT